MKNFIPGKWYICSCNANYYRFLKFTSKNKDTITFDAQINPTNSIIADVKPGFIERIITGSRTEYFSPNKEAINEWTKKYNKILNYEIY